MRRYAETLFRYWPIILIPLLVLPVAGLLAARRTPVSYAISANVQVNDSPPGYTNQYTSPAQNEVTALNEFLQSPSSVGSVVAAATASNSNSRTTNSVTLSTSIVKNLQVTTRGDHLVNVSYNSEDAALGTQVVLAFITTVQSQQRIANSTQTQGNLYVLNYQLREAQKQVNQSYKMLHNYMDNHGDSPSDLTTSTISDPQLASMYQQYQLDVSNVADLRQQISKAKAQAVVPPGTAQQGAFSIKDYPAAIRTSAVKTILLNVGIALAVALLLSGGFLVAKTLSDRSLRYADEVPELLDLPVLTVVPYSGVASSRRGRTVQAAALAPRGQLADV